MTFSSSNNLYGFPQPLTRVFPAPIIAQRAPLTSDIAYPIGQLWVDEVGNDYYGLVDVTAASATWSVLAAQPGNIDTLTGNSGGAITPVAGNIDILGGPGVVVTGTAGTLTIDLSGGGIAMDSFVPDAGTNPVVPTALGAVTMAGTANQITTTGGLNSLTFSLPSAITAPGSLTTTTTLEATTTVTAGTGITATTGNIAATAGNVTAGAAMSATTTVTAGTGITSTTGNIVATAGAVNAGTTMTATLGAITATNGNLVLGTAGNKIIIPTGANASVGVSEVMSGTPGAVTVATTACSATAKVFYCRATTGGTPGNVSITAQDGTGFTLTSTGNETSTFNWWIINA